MPGAIEQILDNLLDNALDAAPSGTTITVTITPAPDTCQLRIADQGAGLTDEQKTNAVRRFWRGDASGPGTGLGLAIVDALATASGGRLELTDTPGGGLTAVVTLPTAPHIVASKPDTHPTSLSST